MDTNRAFRKKILVEISKEDQDPLRFAGPGFSVPFYDSEEAGYAALEKINRRRSKLIPFKEVSFVRFISRENIGIVFWKGSRLVSTVFEPKLCFLRNGDVYFILKGEYPSNRRESPVHHPGMCPIMVGNSVKGTKFLVEMLGKARDGMFDRFLSCPEFISDFMTTLQSYKMSRGTMSGYFNNKEMHFFVDQLKDLDFSCFSNLNQVSTAIDRTGFHRANQKGLSTLTVQVVMALGLTRKQWFEEVLRFLFENKKKLNINNFNKLRACIIFRKFGSNIAKIYENLPDELKK